MVKPVIGPTTVIDRRRDPTNAFSAFYDRRVRYKQKPPFTLVLPYSRTIGEVIEYSKGNGVGSISWCSAEMQPPNMVPSSVWTQLNNLSYERIKSKLYQTAEVGITLVEYNQAISMIGSAAATLVNFTKSLKRLDFPGAAKALQMKFVPPGVSKKKAFADNFLEYTFGWVPLIETIFDCVNVMNDPNYWFTIHKAGAQDQVHYNAIVDSGSVYSKRAYHGTVTVVQRGRVLGIRDGTAHNLEAFGINNPYSLLWEVVPFSFVVDWFVNVGDYIASYTDFAGIEIDNECVSSFYNVTASYAAFRKSDNAPGWSCKTKYKYSERTDKLTGTRLNPKKLEPPNPRRAAIAISLLLQRWPRK